MRLVEQDIAAVKGLYGRYPDDRIVHHVAYEVRDDLDPLSFQFEVVLVQRLDSDRFPAYVSRPDNCFPNARVCRKIDD